MTLSSWLLKASSNRSPTLRPGNLFQQCSSKKKKNHFPSCPPRIFKVKSHLLVASTFGSISTDIILDVALGLLLNSPLSSSSTRLNKPKALNLSLCAILLLLCCLSTSSQTTCRNSSLLAVSATLMTFFTFMQFPFSSYVNLSWMSSSKSYSVIVTTMIQIQNPCRN